MKKILILIGCFFLFACSSKKTLPITEKTVVDSVFVTKTVVQRDTLIIIPDSKATVKIPVQQLTEIPVVKKNGQASVNLRKEADTIIAEANCSELELKIKLQDSLIETLKSRKEIITVPAEAESKPWYEGVLKTLGVVFLLLLAAVGVTVLIKYFTK